MNTKLLMASSALLLGAAGVAPAFVVVATAVYVAFTIGFGVVVFGRGTA